MRSDRALSYVGQSTFYDPVFIESTDFCAADSDSIAGSEPLSRDKLDRLGHVALGCVRAAVTSAMVVASSATSANDEIELAAAVIVQRAVRTFSRVFSKC